MPGKTVVFCEGIREATLISIILDQKGIHNKIIPNESLKEETAENNRINDFLRSRNKSIKFLLKDEGGDTKCAESFLNLYEDKDDRYTGVVFIDSTGQQYLKRRTQEKFMRDILKRESDNLYLTKDPKNPRIVHRIFFTPEDLERQVMAVTGKNLDLQNRDEMRVVLKDFITRCREMRIEWFSELEHVVLAEA